MFSSCNWRRTCGIVVLAIACLFTAGWIRSRTYMDDVEIGFGYVAYGVTSMGGGLDFYRFTFNDVPKTLEWPNISTTSSQYFESNTRDVDPWSSHEIEWRRDWLGFHIGVAKLVGSGQRPRRDQDCMVPYWAVVCPLTLLAGLLMLFTRRPSKSPKQIESAANNDQASMSNGIGDATA